MAAAITKELWLGNRVNMHNVKLCIGTGAPANTDNLVTDTHRFPVGTEYIDTTAKKKYCRCSVSVPGVAADYIDLSLGV